MSAAGNQTKATSIPAIERASERSWADWLTLFEAEGAAKLPHSEIAKIALAALPESLQNPHWWAQGVAIAFEQHTGLRVPGQSSTGDFRVSASRTMSCNRDEAIERWIARFARSTHLGGVLYSRCDGSVHFAAETISQSVWSAMATIQGREVIDGSSW